MAGSRQHLFWWPAVSPLLLFLSAVWGRRVELDGTTVVLPSPNTLRLPPSRNDTAVAYGDSTRIQLRLCECERATGAPSGLSCDKEGWFISSWERQGQWVVGGGYVPLSHAICCRPCLPDELPPDPSGRIPSSEVPVGIISLGCHASTDRSLSTRCETSAGSFVSGYSSAVKVFTTPDTFYPINTVQCCTPALLLSSGDVWELERCGCHDSPDPDFPINCGGTNTDELLLGYVFSRLSPLGHVVPVGPAQCCNVCLSGTVHPMSECDDLNACSNHGVCNLHNCQCFEGWAGADCGQPARNSKGIPPWAIALIVLSSSALAGIFIIVAGYALQALGLAPNTPGSEDDNGDERQPLLIRLDADDAGSVGSSDTTDCEDEAEADEVERRVTRAIQRLETAVAEAEGQQPGAAPARGAPAEAGAAVGETLEEAGEAGSGHDRHNSPVISTAQQHVRAAGSDAEMGSPPSPPPPAAEDSAAVAAPCGNDIAEPQKQQYPRLTPEGPLAMVDCTVCMCRPVQVVVVPCGHVCMCRRCSRRLKRCPMCRKEIARRQRLFV